MRVQGEHPKHKGLDDPQQLGTVERYFVEIMDIPRLQQRIDCFIFTRQFAPNINRVCAAASLPPAMLLSAIRCGIGKKSFAR